MFTKTSTAKVCGCLLSSPDRLSRSRLAAAVRAKIGTLSLEAQKKLEEDVAKAEKKADKKADAAFKKQQVSKSRVSVVKGQQLTCPCCRNRQLSSSE